ncbi:hypothetical protein OIDMADRAFT_184520 [Oidiodendron maius Zn]|uniref:Uncharacterized protein n=1 Tax=Oidiodendron maius (strain Zn) TaxID=913774 RepID=A0A0C3GUM4_OIDMZ|nr:hypothetical protein OIDMADRAFT_184520 [Oidiodendron maius Zn]
MLLSTCFSFVSLLSIVLAQVNLQLALQELPVKCAGQTLPPAGCALEDISSCLCTNTTLQSQLSICVQTSCNRTEQYSTISVSQNLICKGAPQQSRSAEVIRITIIISSVAFLVVILRLCSRYFVAKIWWDDWAIIAAAVRRIYTVDDRLRHILYAPLFLRRVLLWRDNNEVLGAANGFGKHAWDIPPGNIDTILELYYIGQILYVLAQNLTKISILLLFLRIFLDEHFRLVTKIAIAWMVCHIIGFFMAVTLQCIPVRAVWDPTQKGKCVSSSMMVAAGAACSIFEDVVIILLPVREIKYLNLGPRKRLAIILMFSLGSFACITSMIRLKYLTSYSVRSLDPSWDSVDIVIWSIIETYTALICANMITIKPLLAKYIPSIFQNTPADSQTPSFSSSRTKSTWDPLGQPLSEDIGSPRTDLSLSPNRLQGSKPWRA